MFDKILVPLDVSAHSVHALENAIQIAKKFDAKVILIHVYSVAYPVSVPPIIATGTLPMNKLCP